MASVGEFNVFDQATLTGLINKPLEARVESEPTIGESIAPLESVQAREVKLQVREINPFGKGQFRAPGATPPLMEATAELREEIIELALLDEMYRIKDEDFLALQSNDENYKRRAGLSVVERGNVLAIRNRRATEDLRWQAFSGTAVITYPSGSQIEIDYGIPSDHKPSASPEWDDHVNSDPIADLKAWQLKSAVAVGSYGTKIHMGTETWQHLIQNDKLTDYLTGTDRPLMVPRKEDVLALLWEGTEIIVTDAGYRAEGSGTSRGINSVTPYLPKGKVLITTPYTIEGERIADMPDGQVIVSTGYNSVDVRQGAQSEVLLEHMSKTHFLRYGSARIPRIRQPGAFVWATAYTP
jgi:hypothetical protein